jgi:hypothetical protein
MPQSSALASLTYATVVVNAVGSVTLTFSRAPNEVSEIGDANAKFIAGYQNVTAQVDVFYSEADHANLEAAIHGASAAASLVLTLASGDTITGNAFVTSFAVTAAANDVQRASIQFQFTGAITIA